MLLCSLGAGELHDDADHRVPEREEELEPAEEHEAEEDQESVLIEEVDDPVMTRREEDRKQPRAVEGRERQEVEHGQKDVDGDEQLKEAAGGIKAGGAEGNPQQSAPEREHEVHRGACQSHESCAEALGSQGLRPELDRFPPAEAHQDQHQGPQRIEVPGGVGGQTPHRTGHPVALKVGGQRVSELVHGYGQDDRGR